MFSCSQCCFSVGVKPRSRVEKSVYELILVVLYRNEVNAIGTCFFYLVPSNFAPNNVFGVCCLQELARSVENVSWRLDLLFFASLPSLMHQLLADVFPEIVCSHRFTNFTFAS